MTLGEKIKEARKQAGLTQEQLAVKLSVSRPAVAKWENNNGMPDVENLKAIATVLNVSIDYLLDDGDEKMVYEIKEAINLEDYPKDKKCNRRDNTAVCAKFSNADAIYMLTRLKKLSIAEEIIDFISPGLLNIADQVNDMSAYYLVEQGNMQFLVNVTKDFITSSRVSKKITSNKFTIGNNIFRKANRNILEKDN